MRAFPAAPKPVSDKPAACPFCRSAAVSTTSKAINDTTYWRCGTCGQIWNHARLLTWKVSR
ncbi:MAG: hypothetical protein ACRD3C_01835 [Vicinamibacterales bacterium]